jgi:hypothetical protein
MTSQLVRRSVLCAVGVLLTMTAVAAINLITGDAGRSNVQPDFSKLNWVRVMYGSEGGYQEAYYEYDGRLWARWETDFPGGDDNMMRRLPQLTRVKTSPRAASRLLTAPDLADYPMLFMSDPGWIVLSERERTALRQYLTNGGFLWADDFWGDAEWEQFEAVMRDVLPDRDWRLITPKHPIFHTVFDLEEMPQIPAIDFAEPNGSTMERGGGHKEPMGPAEDPSMRAWVDDEGRIMVVATHNNDTGDGWEREAYGQWYFETFSTRAYMLGTNIVIYAMTH